MLMQQEQSVATSPLPNFRLDIGMHPSEHPRLSCAIFATADQFLASRNEWDELVRNAEASVYQSFDWSWAWWKYLGDRSNRRLNILVFRERQTTVGIAPFFLEEQKLAGMTLSRRLSLLGTGMAFYKSFGIFFDDGPSDYLDVIAAPGYEQQVAEALARYFEETRKHVDEIELLNAPEMSIIMTRVLSQMKKKGAVVRVSRADVNSRLLLPATSQEYLQGLGSNVRRRFSQARQALGGKNVFQMKEVETEEDLEELFAQLVDLHRRRWNDMGYPGYFWDMRYYNFQRSFVSEMLSQKRLWFKTVWADGHCVGARLGFSHNGAMYDYLTGFDKETATAKYRPGYALLLLMIEDAIATRHSTVELLRGDERYKAELLSNSFYSSNAVIVNVQPFQGLRTIASTLVRAAGFLGFLISRELILLRVQYTNHGPLKFLYYWAEFRGSRSVNKAFRAIEREHGIVKDYHEDHTMMELINLLFKER